jgi:hypothetical protein
MPTTDLETLAKSLEEASVPITLDSCRACPNPCDDDAEDYHHEEWPRMEIDTSSDMLGSVKPYYRQVSNWPGLFGSCRRLKYCPQVVISTGRSDWPREVTDVTDTLANHLSQCLSSHKVVAKDPNAISPPVQGLFNPNGSSRLGILNGSHHTHCDGGKHDVLVFPDYKIITDVEATSVGADALWSQTLDPKVGRAGKSEGSYRSWVLPYNAVLLLCKALDRCLHAD